MTTVEGSVVVPQHLAAEALRLLARALVAEARETGAQPSPAAAQLLADLHRATQQPATPDPASFVSETTTAASPKVEISAADAAVILGCSVQYVRQLCRSGASWCRRVGRVWLIDPAGLDTWRHSERTP